MVYLIKDIARLSGYSIHTVKYYLKIGLIKENAKSPETGYRYFDEGTVQKLKDIRQMRKKALSIREIQSELLRIAGAC